MNREPGSTAEPAIGTDVVTISHGDNVVFVNYVVERPAHTPQLKAVEAVLEVRLSVPHPVRRVWPVFIDFNAWMNRFGYVWEFLPAKRENQYAYLGNIGTANDIKYATETRTKYVVRKVIPEQLIYLDSVPLPIAGKDGVWSGHNVMSLREQDGRTEISVFMEHTWYSPTMSLGELRAEARGIMFDIAVAFWRDYFVPDLLSLIETGKVSAAGPSR